MILGLDVGRATQGTRAARRFKAGAGKRFPANRNGALQFGAGCLVGVPI